MYQPIQCRLATHIGVRISLRRYWDDCPVHGYHDARIHVKDVLIPADQLMVPDGYGGMCYDYLKYHEDYDHSLYPKQCDHCKGAVPDSAPFQVFTEHLYDTPSGSLEPGCLYWAPWLPEDFIWENHKGPHLYAVCPDGGHWNIDGRASNCTMHNERTHRCWVRHGEPPNITVDKNGHTCQAGGGSIISNGNGYHGHLQNGWFTAG
ncbi:MAG TPA: hypothetical protein PLC60_08405 [Saprospiraceae bacterium]|nr:hypothetical protein [Saprospiraceae bacterium]